MLFIYAAVLLAVVCEPHCWHPCTELNGDVHHECGTCSPEYSCSPGAATWPTSPTVARVGVEANGGAVHGDGGAVSDDSGVGSLNDDDDDNMPQDDDVDGFTCAPYYRTLGEGDLAVHVCPIFNGIWTSFLDFRKWGRYDERLTPALSAQIARGMALYDEIGMSTWIGEDFDERVLSSLEAHRAALQDQQQEHHHHQQHEQTASGQASVATLRYSIIVEHGYDVALNLRQLSERLGDEATHWVQLGPPALDHLPAYRTLQVQKKVRLIGVEDFTVPMLEAAARAFHIATVQQEINVIVRPSAETQTFCVQHGCKFVAYGPLLGGLLSDRYLGRDRPVPDHDHSKQIDYLASIDAWAGWEDFQYLLQALWTIADAHTPSNAVGSRARISISTVALAYVLHMENVLGAIVGVRLGTNVTSASDGVRVALGTTASVRSHRRDALAALQLRLTSKDIEAIDAAVRRGQVLDGLERA